MATQRLATQLIAGNPVRVQQWNASIRAGDDLKLALTVYADDQGTPASVQSARGLLTLATDASAAHIGYAGGYGTSGWDYGAGWFPHYGTPTAKAIGYSVPDQPGRMNFVVPSATSAGLSGRYRLTLQLDTAEGETCQVEGIVQVRAAWMGGKQLHTPAMFFRLDHSPLDGDSPLATQLSANTLTNFQLDRSHLDGTEGLIGGSATNGQPVDADGFFLMAATFLPVVPPAPASVTFNPQLGQVALGGFVLGDFIP